MIKKLLLTFFLVLVQTVVFGATKTYIGTNSDWNTATNWSPNGLPTATDDVVIPSGSTVTMISTSVTIATFTIYGQLVLLSDTSHTINTTSLIVVSPSGSIKFDKKSDIKLPTNTPIQVNAGGLLGDCSNNNSIFIGTVEVAVCVGGGNTIPTFAEVMASGGYNIINVSPTYSSACGSGSFSFTATAIPSTAATIKWYDAASGGNLLQTGTSGSSNTYTSPIISTTTTYYADATVGSFTTPRKAVVATVYSLPTISGSLNVCIGSTTTLTGSATANATTPWTSASTGVATVNSSGVVTGVAAGTSVITYKNSNGCDRTVTVTVSALSVPSVGTITQPTCTLSTGSVVLNGLPASGTWTLTRSGASSATTTGTGTSTTISGLALGTYYFTVSNGSCTSEISLGVPITSPDKTWNGSVSSDWNTAANWTPSGVPASSNCVTIPYALKSPTISGTNFVAYANNLTILNSGILKVKSSNAIIVTDFVDVDLSGGTLIFENTASLVQINNVTTKDNSGFIDYQRTTSARPTDYTYWSSPVSPMDLGELYPYEGTYYSYEATISGEDWKQEGSDTEMVAGKGYIANQGAAVPSGMPPPPGLLDVTFTGVPNNGSYPISVFKDKSCLLGNPYPSAIDANTFLNENTGVLFGTLYFWTHNTAIQDASNITDGSAGSGAFAYTSNDYAIYNATGGTAANQPDKDALGNSYPSTVPTGNIAAGQGFFATAKTTGTVIFNNTTRVTGNNSQFFKTKNPNKSAKTIEKNRIWLNLTNTQGAFKQTLVGYITDATNDYDERFDGESYDGNEFVDFYSVNQDKNLVIQGRALPFDENDEVPLGYRTTINGAFTISIDQVDGFLTNQAVFIEDKLTNAVTDLKSGNYTFNTVAGTFNDRFVLKYTNKTLGTETFDSLEKTVLVSNKNKQIKIDSAVEMIDKVTIFDLLGRQIYQKANVDSNELSISNLVSNRQMLMVKTTLQNGKTVTKKVIY